MGLDYQRSLKAPHLILLAGPAPGCMLICAYQSWTKYTQPDIKRLRIANNEACTTLH